MTKYFEGKKFLERNLIIAVAIAFVIRGEGAFFWSCNFCAAGTIN